MAKEIQDSSHYPLYYTGCNLAVIHVELSIVYLSTGAYIPNKGLDRYRTSHSWDLLRIYKSDLLRNGGGVNLSVIFHNVVRNLYLVDQCCRACCAIMRKFDTSDVDKRNGRFFYINMRIAFGVNQRTVLQVRNRHKED